MKYLCLLVLLAGCGEIKLKLPTIPRPPVHETGVICQYTCADGLVDTSHCGEGYEYYQEFFVGDPCPCMPGKTLCWKAGVM